MHVPSALVFWLDDCGPILICRQLESYVLLAYVSIPTRCKIAGVLCMTHFIHVGTVNDTTNGRHNLRALSNQQLQISFDRDITLVDFDIDAESSKIFYQIYYVGFVLATSRCEYYVPCSVLRHPGGNSSANASGTASDEVGYIFTENCWLDRGT